MNRICTENSKWMRRQDIIWSCSSHLPQRKIVDIHYCVEYYTKTGFKYLNGSIHPPHSWENHNESNFHPFFFSEDTISSVLAILPTDEPVIKTYSKAVKFIHGDKIKPVWVQKRNFRLTSDSNRGVFQCFQHETSYFSSMSMKWYV